MSLLQDPATRGLIPLYSPINRVFTSNIPVDECILPDCRFFVLPNMYRVWNCVDLFAYVCGYCENFLKIFPDVWVYNYVYRVYTSLCIFIHFFLILGIGKIPEMFFILHKKKVIRWEEFFCLQVRLQIFNLKKKTIYGTYHRLDIYVHVLCKVMSELGFWFKCLLQGHTVQIKDFKTTKAIIFGYK